MKIVLTVIRVIVGVLFIFSGLVKANDPLGLSYKMQEFFDVWGMHGLNEVTLVLSILMIAFEIIAGVAVILGWKMRLFSWLLLLLIIFFTFLTAYALFSGKIKTCGCFGDCIPLTAAQSFWKDIILTVLILIIFANRNKIQPMLSNGKSMVVLLLTVIFSFGAQWYVLQHLPVVDCLPYKKGANIPEGMKIPANAIPDSMVITFVYNKDGKEVEFTAEEFPEDFDDSTYTFVKRYDRLIRKGNAEPAIKDFSLSTPDGFNVTDLVLATPGIKILYFAKDLATPVKNWAEDFRNIQKEAQQRNKPLYVVTATADVLDDEMKKEGLSGYQLLKCDVVAIKTAARTNPTLYLINEGTILGKWGKADLDKALKVIKTMEGGTPQSDQ
ncbi:MAG TPA: BT_3928 family protein [Parasegetibacter sp.]